MSDKIEPGVIDRLVALRQKVKDQQQRAWDLMDRYPPDRYYRLAAPLIAEAGEKKP